MTYMKKSRAFAIVAALSVVGAPLLAQQKPAPKSTTKTPSTAAKQQAQPGFDRTAVPAAGKTPELRVPAWTRQSLSNGAQLIVSERHNLPLVSFNITFIGGANQYEPADKRGLASFVASMLSEGTKNRTGDQLSADLQLLGTSVNTGIGGETGAIGFFATKDKFEPTLAILQ